MRKGFFITGIAAAVVLAGAWYAFSRDAAPASDREVATSVNQEDVPLTLRSSTFTDGEVIPSKYTCDSGGDLNPQLSFEGVPTGTQSLVLIMDDPDIAQSVKTSRGIDAFDHWILFNITPTVTEIEEGSSVGTSGENGVGRSAYMGPCPPRGVQPTEHGYSFRLYALDTTLALEQGASKQSVKAAMQGHVIEETELIGRYERQ